MADYTATARSNYFRLRDDAARAELDAFIRDHDLDITIVTSREDPARIALLADTGNGWPSHYFDESAGLDSEAGPHEQGGDYIDFTIWDVVGPLLADDCVAVFIEVGHEKLRSLSGVAVAVNNQGETRQVLTNDIYPLAAQLGSDVTDAEQ